MADRNARLAALAAKAGRTKTVPEGENEDDDNQEHFANEEKDEIVVEMQEEVKQQVQFRNYAPKDVSLLTTITDKEQEQPASKRPRTDNDEPRPSLLQEALEKAKQDVAMEVVASKHVDNNVNLSMAGPKKINWDLKRDIQGKLDKLERRTQRAIVHLLKKKLEQEAADEMQQHDLDNDNDDSDLD